MIYYTRRTFLLNSRRPGLDLEVRTSGLELTATEARYVCGTALPICMDLVYRCAGGCSVAGEVRVSPAGADWLDFLTLRLKHEDPCLEEVIPSWRPWVVGARARLQGTDLTVAPGRRLGASCVLPPGFTEELPAGSYVLMGVFDTSAVSDPEVVRCRLEAQPWQFSLDPADSDGARARVLVSRSRFAWESRDYQQAERLAAEATRLAPEDAFTWAHLGNASLATRNWQGAIDAFQNYLRLKPRSACSNYGIAAAEAGITVARNAIARGPNGETGEH